MRVSAEPRQGMERRRSTRFRLCCAVTCTWVDDFGLPVMITGSTQDISAGGLFVTCEQRPPAGAVANLEIRLPGRRLPGQGLQLHGNGRVVRMVQDGKRSGFAVASSFSWTLGRNKVELVHTAS